MVSPGFQSFFTSSLIFFFLLFLFSILGEVGLCLLTRFFVVEAQWTQIVIQVLILSSERDQDRDCQVVGRDVEAASGPFQAKNPSQRIQRS